MFKDQRRFQRGAHAALAIPSPLWGGDFGEVSALPSKPREPEIHHHLELAGLREFGNTERVMDEPVLGGVAHRVGVDGYAEGEVLGFAVGEPRAQIDVAAVDLAELDEGIDLA